MAANILCQGQPVAFSSIVNFDFFLNLFLSVCTSYANYFCANSEMRLFTMLSSLAVSL